MGIRDFGRFDIKFHFNGKVLVLKVTKFSTCDDVIHMILHKEGLPVTKVMLYAVFERTGSAERMLSGKTLIYKVWRSWGCESKHFEFHIRSKATKLGIKNIASKKNAESCIDELFLDQYNRKAHTTKRHISFSGEKSVSFNLENNNAQDSTDPRQTQSVSSGKRIVLARYMYDLFTRSTRKKSNTTAVLAREQADGTENQVFQCIAECSAIGKETSLSQHTKCTYLWNKYYTSDSENESDDSLCNTSYDNNSVIYRDETVTLDTAFIKSSGDSDSDEGIDVTSVTSADLDTAFLGDFENKYSVNITNEADKFNDGSTAYEECCNRKGNKFEMNISDDEFLKDIFGKAGIQAVTSEDDEMDSFMRSRLDSF